MCDDGGLFWFEVCAYCCAAAATCFAPYASASVVISPIGACKGKEQLSPTRNALVALSYNATLAGARAGVAHAHPIARSPPAHSNSATSIAISVASFSSLA